MHLITISPDHVPPPPAFGQATLVAIGVPSRRARSFRQCDVARAMRAASAAGVNVKVVIEDGRITLVPIAPIQEADAAGENPWKKLRHG